MQTKLIAIHTKVSNKDGLTFVMDYKGRFNIWEDEKYAYLYDGKTDKYVGKMYKPLIEDLVATLEMRRG